MKTYLRMKGSTQIYGVWYDTNTQFGIIYTVFKINDDGTQETALIPIHESLVAITDTNLTVVKNWRDKIVQV